MWALEEVISFFSSSSEDTITVVSSHIKDSVKKFLCALSHSDLPTGFQFLYLTWTLVSGLSTNPSSDVSEQRVG